MKILPEILLPLFYTLIFLVVVYKWRFFKLDVFKKHSLPAVFLLKIIFGVTLTLLYSSFGDRKSGDAFRFYDDATIIYSTLPENPPLYLKFITGVDMQDPALEPYYKSMTHWERRYEYGVVNDNVTMIRFNAILLLFSGGHYYVHVVFICFLSFLGLTALLKAFLFYFPEKKSGMFLAVYLMPSVLFWGSGVLKESLHLFFFGFAILYSLTLFDEEFKWSVFLKLLLVCFGLYFLKGYALLAIIPAWICLFILKITGTRYYWQKVLTVHVVGVLMVFNIKHVLPEYDVLYMMQQKQKAFYNEAHLSKAGSVIDIPRFHSATEWIVQSPVAVANALFRPFIHEIKKPVYLLAALENLFIILCLIIMIWNFRPPSLSTFPIMVVAGSFFLIMLALMGSTVPILGALVRYKIPTLPFVMMFIFAFTNRRLLNKRLPFFKKLQKIL